MSDPRPGSPHAEHMATAELLTERRGNARTASPEDLAFAQRSVDEGRFASVEEFLAADDAFREFVGELCAELKPTAEDYAWADRVLGLSREQP